MNIPFEYNRLDDVSSYLDTYIELDNQLVQCKLWSLCCLDMYIVTITTVMENRLKLHFWVGLNQLITLVRHLTDVIA